ncbi:alpha-L-fucosidase [Streptomyces sp. NPDC020917]|uniref:alpha-L-fucosidase n=1 Tax=Streptomyces sp. NPDC020917 TaxID=3365102 RepID=UPI0037936ADD
MSHTPTTGAGADANGPAGFSRRGLLATMAAAAAVPVVAGSPAWAQSGTQQAAAAHAAGLDPTNAGNVLASLRFGMFVHFNPSSLLGREISWGRNAYRPGEGPGNQYQDPSVKADPVYDAAYRSFLPEPDWATKLAATAKAAGMTYLVFTTKHHDGYPNFRATNVARSFYSDFADTPLGRSGRDLTREIAHAARKAGLKFGVYYSPRDWTQPDYAKGDYSTYFTYMMEHLQQLLTQYGKVDFLWYDHMPYTDMAVFRPPLLNTVPRGLQQGILVNDRGYNTMGFQSLPDTLAADYTNPEGYVGAFNAIRPWESCITITPGSWAWQPNHPASDYPTVVQMLVQSAGNDGNLLLNVPPTSTGYLEDDVTTTLKQVGRWMSTYSAAIIGTRGGPYPSRSGVGGATYRGTTVNVHILGDLVGFNVRLPALNAKVSAAVTIDGRRVPFTEDTNGDLLLDLTGITKPGPDLCIKLTVAHAMTSEYVTRKALSWEIVKPKTANLAKGKPVQQHSIAYGGVPERAVDGNTDGTYTDGSVTHTSETANQAWWQVDLGASTDIGQVWVYNRTDTPYNLRLSNFWVMASDNEFTSADLTASRTAPGVTAVRIDGPNGDVRPVDLNGRGRYVRVQLEADATPLSLAEVEVYAR